MRVHHVESGEGIFAERGRPFFYSNGHLYLGNEAASHEDLARGMNRYDFDLYDGWQAGYVNDEAMAFDLAGTGERPRPALACWLAEQGYDRAMVGDEDWRDTFA